MKTTLLVFFSICGSIYAAEKSLTEIVSFNNEDKQFRCNGQNIEWYFPNNSRIHHKSEKFHIENPNENESILTIRKISASSIGVYKCISVSSMSEADFDLKLYYPLAINHFNRLQTVQEGDNVTLKCKTISIPKVAKITWYHQDRELVPQSDYVDVRDGILLKNIKAENAGKYSCVAKQELGTFQNIQQRDMELIVEYGPQQTANKIKIILARIGETLDLNCEVKCEPSPVFKWLINGYETFENVHIRNHVSRLKLKINTEQDFQTYTCLASNVHGQSNQTFVLKENMETEQSTSRTSPSKTAGVVLYTLMMIISTVF